VPETVTVTCVRHRCKVKTEAPARPGAPVVILHDPGDAKGRICDSERFTIRREQVLDRLAADAELMVLRLYEEHRRAVRDGSEEER
jgi:hypothetical protein